jgi:hypothetical protein
MVKTKDSNLYMLYKITKFIHEHSRQVSLLFTVQLLFFFCMSVCLYVRVCVYKPNNNSCDIH